MSNSSFPWFPFYARDWLTDVQVRAMPLAVRGAYVDLLALQWENGGLPKDPEQVRQLLGIHGESWPSWWDQLERHFPVVAEDWLTERRNPRLEQMRAEKIAKHSKQSAGGLITAAKRRAKQSADLAVPLAVRASESSSLPSEEISSSEDIVPSSSLPPEEISEGTHPPGGGGTQVVKPKKKPRKKPGKPYPYPKLFLKFWDLYPARNQKKLGKRATYAKFAQIAETDLEDLYRAAKHYSQSKIARVDGMAKDPERFFVREYWRDWIDGPGTDEHVEERDRIRPPEPQADPGGPPARPDDVAAELGFGSLREATRGIPGARSAEEISGDLEKEGGGLTKQPEP